jgi:DNA-binding NarL/FixJ family response regulator
MSELIRICVVEDTPEIQRNLRTILGTAPDMVLLAVHGSAEEAERAAPSISAELYIVDINLPGRSGIEFITRVRQGLPHTQFMVFTVHDDDARVFEALKCGANGYLLKGASPTELLDALRELHAGGAPMSASVARRLVEHLRPKSARPKAVGLIELSERENEVLDLLAQGLLYKEIAERLFIALSTVKQHIHNIYGKLHVQSRTEAVVRWLGR